MKVFDDVSKPVEERQNISWCYVCLISSGSTIFYQDVNPGEGGWKLGRNVGAHVGTVPRNGNV